MGVGSGPGPVLVSPTTLADLVRRFLPVFRWGACYDRHALCCDLSAGVAVGLVLFVQGVAFAALAGLPASVGIRSCVVPLLAYAVFGASRQVGIGPTVINSPFLSTLLDEFTPGETAPRETDRRVFLAITLCLLTGIIQAGLGAMRAGVLVGFLAKPTVARLKAGAAALVICKEILLVVVPSRPGIVTQAMSSSWMRGGVLPSVIAASSATSKGNLLSAATAIGTGCVIWALWEVCRRRRAGLSVAGLLVSVIGVFATLGHVSRGLQPVAGDFAKPFVPFDPLWPSVISLDDIALLAPGSFALAMIGYLECITPGREWAAANNYLLNGNAELSAVGLSNIVGALFMAHPVGASPDRSTLNAGFGSRSPLAIGCAGLVAYASGLIASPVISAMPRASLRAVVIASCAPLIYVNIPAGMRAVRWGDKALWAIATLCTCFGGVSIGLRVACICSLILITSRIARPNFAVVGRVPGTQLYRDITRYPDTIIPRGVVPLRFDAPIHFGNAQRFRDIIDHVCDLFPEMRVLVLDMTVINDIDASGLEALENVVVLLRHSEKELHLCGARGPVRDFLRRSGFIPGGIPESNVWASLAPCVEAIAARL